MFRFLKNKIFKFENVQNLKKKGNRKRKAKEKVKTRETGGEPNNQENRPGRLEGPKIRKAQTWPDCSGRPV
jgi:hypothetical protein